MVRVHALTTDKITAWRIRDLLAEHPLLGGAAAQIDVCADHEYVLVTGWTADERLSGLTRQLTISRAGRRVVSIQLDHGSMCDPIDGAHCRPDGGANGLLT